MVEDSRGAERSLLGEESRQVNEYVRALGTALLTWFAMFGTVNTLAISWFADRFGSGKSDSLGAVLVVGAFFVLQSLLAVFALRPLHRYLLGAADRLNEIVALQSPTEARTAVAPQEAPRTYAHVVLAIMFAMASFAAIWLALSVVGVQSVLASRRLVTGG